MAPRPRDAPPAPGLLASALSFVSRELESFVTAAKGGEVQKEHDHEHEHNQPEASSSRVKLVEKWRKRGEGREKEGGNERERKAKRVRRRSEVESDRTRAKRRMREEGEGERMNGPTRKTVQRDRERNRSSEREAADDEDDELPVRPLPKSLKKTRDIQTKNAQRDGRIEDVGGPEPERSEKGSARLDADPGPTKLMPPSEPMPHPPSPLPVRMKTPFPTMPGSLFPRSESLMPEVIPASLKRIIPRPRTPPPPLLEGDEETQEEADQDSSASPDAQAQASIRRGRSANRIEEVAHCVENTVRLSSARDSSRHSDASGRAGSSSRISMEEQLSEPFLPPRTSKGKERAYNTSGEIRVQGMEQELREAREDHARNAHGRDNTERGRDKQRIRLLEEEVARLRAELALKSSPSTVLMPPPPPPPPPPLMRTHRPAGTSGETGSFLASARANLKPTAPPVEVPINSAAYGGGRTRKAGQPTVNVPSDKMAAFLREMKTVRLRRVGGREGSMGPPLFAPSAAGDVAGELTRSTSGKGMSDARRAAVMGDTSFDTGVAARIFIGEKRKRDVLGELATGPSKRRETTFTRSDTTGGPSCAASSQSSSSSQSSASSSQPSASSSRTAGTTKSLADIPLRSRPRTSAPLRIWPTQSTETELTTPSLCSDNENDHSEDRLPETPSDSGRGVNVDVLPAERRPQPKNAPEVIDVDALETPPKSMLMRATPDHPAVEGKGETDAFARRPPASPMPANDAKTASTTKPKPPARAKTKTKIPKLVLPRRVPVVQPRAGDSNSDSDDPLLMARARPNSQSRRHAQKDRARVEDEGDVPVAGPSRTRDAGATSYANGGSRSQIHIEVLPELERSDSRLSNHARRRLTLDEELRRAGDSLWHDEEEVARPASEPEEDLDSGLLVALGRSSRKGFLARGGGAGSPVFMGEGYVEGASASAGEDGGGRL